MSFIAGSRINEPSPQAGSFFDRLNSTGVMRVSDTPKPKVLDLHGELLLEILKKLQQVIPEEDEYVEYTL